MHKARRTIKAMLSEASNNARQIICALSILSLVLSPVVVQAAPYETYVIATYGGDSLLPAVREQLSHSRDGGTVTTYQDKLVLRTTATNYQAVQQLLMQIDGQPQALTVAVRVGNSRGIQDHIQQGRVIITNRGIQGTGTIGQSNHQQQSSSVYQVQTLSGSPASISTGMLWSLTQNYRINGYPTYNRQFDQIIIQQQVLLPTTQGIAVTPRVLPSGQVEVRVSQTEETLVRSRSPYRQNSRTITKGQHLDSTIIVPRGQWIDIGQISQSTQNRGSGYGSNRTTSSHNSVPISILVQ